jgi:hypothetical protein
VPIEAEASGPSDPRFVVSGHCHRERNEIISRRLGTFLGLLRCFAACDDVTNFGIGTLDSPRSWPGQIGILMMS